MRYLLLLIMILIPLELSAKSGEQRPYAETSPWNLPLSDTPLVHPQSDVFITTLSQSGYLGSKVTAYTLPVYIVEKVLQKQKVYISGYFSEVHGEDGGELTIQRAVSVEVALPRNARPALGTDSQLILWDPKTGTEWGFWQLEGSFREGWRAVNGYCYNTRWSGVPPTGFISRGAGVPYLTGLIRPWEIEQGHIEHALALAVNLPARDFVYPATKSDGKEYFPDIPMGARLQLDPALTDADFTVWGLDTTGKIIARAMQEYGLIVIDGSGHPKIYAEYEGTAQWQGLLHDKTITNIPYRHFRVLYTEAMIP